MKKLNLFILLCLALLANRQTYAQDGFWLPVDANGWTVITESPDTRKVYVSSSEGDDNNDGLSPATPKATINAANNLIRDGYPDWLLLKRGDTFPQPNLARWKGGGSATEPMVISYYGDSGPRPVIMLTGKFVDWNGQNRNHTAYIGLDFYRSLSDPDSEDFNNSSSDYALRFVPGSEGISMNVLVEDCRFRFCNMLVQSLASSNRPKDVVIRRNIFMGNWIHSSSTSTGARAWAIYVSGIDGFIAEENLFHHNGHNAKVEGAGPNDPSNTIQMQQSLGGTILARGNIFSHGASRGIDLRSGGQVLMNAFVGNTRGVTIGNNAVPVDYQDLTQVSGNVVTDGRSFGPQLLSILGLENSSLAVDAPTREVNDNIVANIKDDNAPTVSAYRAFSTPNQYGSANIGWNWGASANNFPQTNPGWTDPTRNADGYAQTLGLDGWDGFLEAASNRPVGQMPLGFTAYAYADYIREGFDKAPVSPPYTYDEECDGVAVTGVSVSPVSLELVQAGDTRQVTAVLAPSDACIRTVLWSSLDPAVATVDEAGVVTAVAAGPTIIRATTLDGGFTADISLTVTGFVAVTGLTLSPQSLSLGKWANRQLTATIQPTDASDQSANWSSSDESIATVDQNGLVVALRPGEATIMATSAEGGFTDACQVTVTGDYEVPEDGYWLPLNAAGWTVIAESHDTQKVYVSSSEGNDANDGLSPQTPKATIDAAMAVTRDGYPDWLLLKRGDTFAQSSNANRRWKSGRNAAEPMVMSYYGDSGPRPVIKLTSPFINWDGQDRNHTAFIGLDLYRSISDPDSEDFNNTQCGPGFRFIPSENGTSTNVLVEDCRLRYCELIVQNLGPTNRPHNVAIRRNIITYVWVHGTTNTTNSLRTSGIYASGLDGFVLEENLFHHNGFSQKVDGAGANVYSHNVYLQYSLDGTILVRGNLISHGAAHGIQLRSGGTAVMNAFVGNAIGMNIGYSTPPTHHVGPTLAVDNVVTDGRPMIPNKWTDPQSGAVWGLDKRLLSSDFLVVNDNIVANVKDNRGYPSQVTPYSGEFSGNPDQFGAGNIAWNWQGGNLRAADQDWTDPTRNADGYAQTQGLSNWDEFVEAASERPVGKMPFNLTAYAYGDYIREGFNLGPVTPPFQYDENQPLPVTLSHFTAVREKNMVQLSWSTTEETGSSRFEVQHSLDVKKWAKLEEVTSRGESTTLTHYGYTHASPSNGINYYRLKMIDRDGSFEFSRMESVAMNGVEDIVAVYPNPVAGRLRLKDIAGPVSSLEIYTLAGRQIASFTSIPSEGVDVHDLAEGLYIVKVKKSNGTVVNSKIIVQK